MAHVFTCQHGHVSVVTSAAIDLTKISIILNIFFRVCKNERPRESLRNSMKNKITEEVKTI